MLAVWRPCWAFGLVPLCCGGTPLCIPNNIFVMLRKHRGENIVWWPSVRHEVRAMRRVLPLLFCDFGAPITPLLFSSDAMGPDNIDGGGYGIVARSAPEPL